MGEVATVGKLCHQCYIYTGQQDRAGAEEEIFGQSGIWKYSVCKEACFMKEMEKERANRIYQRERYRRLHPEAKRRVA